LSASAEAGTFFLGAARPCRRPAPLQLHSARRRGGRWMRERAVRWDRAAAAGQATDHPPGAARRTWTRSVSQGQEGEV